MVYSDSNLELDPQTLRLAGPESGVAEPFQKVRHPLSGSERNRLFLNEDMGSSFAEASAISGFDHPADGRALGVLDFDRDGFLDLAVVNANAPLLQLFHNNAGQLVPRSTARFLAVRLRGGNSTASSDQLWSTRDGVGAVVEVQAGGRTFVREQRYGEGFASQNSRTLLIGLGDVERIDEVTVTWPGGTTQQLADPPLDRMVTFFENEREAGAAHQVDDYLVHSPKPRRPTELQRLDIGEIDLMSGAPRSSSRIRLFATMATWCVACLESYPQLELLTQSFPSDELEILGVPVDGNEGPELLGSYVRDHDPPYELVSIDSPLVDSLREHVASSLGEAIPAYVAVDGQGHILTSQWGAPSVSQVGSWLWSLTPSN